MRLGDLDALKEKVNAFYDSHFKQIGLTTYAKAVNIYIDNAPTVEIPCNQIIWEQGYECGKNERPQGDMLPVGTTINIKPEDIKWNGGDQISRETIEKIIVGMLEKWADGYSYIEIPTDDAIREMKSAIDNVQPVVVNCKDCDGYEAGYSAGLKDAEKSQVECENCDFRKFSDSFIDGIVDVMTKNGITSVEQLSELLKGDKE